jgi:hypothetical protein
MRARHVKLKPSQVTEQAGRQIRFIWYLFCWSILWRWKVLPGQTVVCPTELLFQFRWSAACLADPISCWENIGVRPSPSARVEEKSGPLSVEMSLISASTWQGPENFKENTPFTVSFVHKSFIMHRCWRVEMRQRHPPCFGLSRKPL